MRRFRSVMPAVVLLLVQACASTPPTPITGIEPLVGKWKGTVNIGRSVDFIYLTINPDQTLIARWGDITARGTVSVSGGRATYQMAPPPQEGTITLYAGKGQPQLYLENLMGSFAATVNPEK
jgi:hypothetical protein